MCTRPSTELFGVALAGFCALAGCGAAPKTADPAAPVSKAKVTSVERFMPLVAGTVYSFETTVENSNDKGVMMVAVDRPRDGMATLTVGGKVERLELVPEGIRLATGGWLLKSPLERGTRYRGGFGEVVVEAIDREVEVPAGRYRGCVVIIEESVTGRKKVTTTFCPDVGMVLMEAEGMIGNDYGHERAALKSYGKRVDINDMGK